MELKRFNAKEIRAERFIKLPQFLFEGEYKKDVSNDAKVLYALLRNRFELSAKNNWVNDKGEVYIIFTREEMCDMLCCQQEKVRKLVKQLISAGLIEEERVGLNMPNRIFLVHPNEVNNNNTPSSSDNDGGCEESNNSSDGNKRFNGTETSKSKNIKCRKTHAHIVKVRTVKKRRSENSGVKKKHFSECRTSSLNKTENKKKNMLFKTHSVHSATKDELKINKNISNERMNDTPTQNYFDEFEKTKSQIEYDLLKQQYPSATANIVDSITELITDIRTSPDAYITNGNKKMPVDAFSFKLGKLTGLEIEGIIERFRDNCAPINNPRAYLTSMLWNAGSELPLTM